MKVKSRESRMRECPDQVGARRMGMLPIVLGGGHDNDRVMPVPGHPLRPVLGQLHDFTKPRLGIGQAPAALTLGRLAIPRCSSRVSPSFQSA